MLTKTQKKSLIKEHAIHEKDSGSAEVQVSFLTKQISELTGHLKKNPKDHSSRRGLLKMVGKRKKFLDYLSTKRKASYDKLIKKLGLKK